MKKERFKEIVTSNSSTTEEIGSLKKLATDYPFSQIIHLLLANSSKNNGDKDFSPSLKNAAFYATDRSIVKSLIQHNLVPSESNSFTATSLITKPTQPVVHTPKVSSVNTEGLAENVLKHLAELQKIKKEATIWLNKQPTPPKEKKKPATKKVAKSTKATKKTTAPKSQDKIIEKFIKEEPRITKNAKPSDSKVDMAKQSSKMREDVISESLAKIYVKQGKVEKAIDIYKKLIWKLPQKKALFAAQIEKLKKK